MGERLVDVYIASGEVEAYIIKGKLEANGIPCIIRSNAAPSVYVFPVDGMGGIRIAVRESIAEEARQVIDDDSYSLQEGEDVPPE